MRTELQAKFLQHLNNKKNSEKGFTLVELLVVIIIIGILAAIALPNFLNQGAKAKQTEAKQNVGMHNRLQTVYRSENAGFADNFNKLAMGTLAGSGSTASTTSYSYTLAGLTDYSNLSAKSQDTALKSYLGASTLYLNAESKNVIASIICETTVPGTAAVGAATTSATAQATCASGSIALGQ
jgi:type IV pilus assembly protein PilA